MAYESASVAMLIIVILVSIIVIVLMIYYSSYVDYGNDDDDVEIENDSNDIQGNISNRRSSRQNNIDTLISNIKNPVIVKKANKKNKIDIIDTSIEDEINRLVKTASINNISNNNHLDNQQILDSNKNNKQFNYQRKTETLLPKKNNEKIDYQEFTNDITVRGKSVNDFMNKKKFPSIIKVNAHLNLTNDIENNTLINFDGNISYKVTLPDNSEGLSLNFWNGSMTSQSISSNIPILSKNTVTLDKILPPSTFISIICTGISWIIINIIGDEHINISQTITTIEDNFTPQMNIVSNFTTNITDSINTMKESLSQNDNITTDQTNLQSDNITQITDTMLISNSQIDIANNLSSIEDDLKKLLYSTDF